MLMLCDQRRKNSPLVIQTSYGHCGLRPWSQWSYLFLQLATSYHVEFWAREPFINEFIIVQISAEDDEVVKKTTRAAEISMANGHTYFCSSRRPTTWNFELANLS